jgi:hypothetical protein
LDLFEGCELIVDGVPWTVERLEPHCGTVVLRGAGSGPEQQSRLTTVRALMHHRDCRPSTRSRPDAPAANRGRQPKTLEDLTAEQRQIVHLRRAHLLEVETGYRSGDPFAAAPGEPRPGYDPAVTPSVGERRRAKVGELAALRDRDPEHARALGLDRISLRTLERMASRYRRWGIMGCADDRWLRECAGHRSITEPIREAIYAVRAECLRNSKISMASRERKIHRREKYGDQITIPCSETLRTVWHEWFGSGGARQRYARSAAAAHAVATGEHVMRLAVASQVPSGEITPVAVARPGIIAQLPATIRCRPDVERAKISFVAIKVAATRADGIVGTRKAGREGDRERFPRSPHDRSTSEVPNSCPGSIATVTPQTFTVASSPTKPTGTGVDPAHTGDSHALRPGPYPPDLSRWNSYGALTADFSRAPSHLACRTRAVWQCQRVPSLSELLPPSPAPPGSGFPQLHRAAATARRRSPSTSARSHSASWRTVPMFRTGETRPVSGVPCTPGPWCSHGRRVDSGHHCRLPAAGPIHRCRLPSPVLWLTRLTGIHVLRPSDLSLACNRWMEHRPLGFLPGFTPRRYQRRMPGAGTGAEHSPGASRRTYIDPPFRLTHSHSATSRRTNTCHHQRKPAMTCDPAGRQDR